MKEKSKFFAVLRSVLEKNGLIELLDEEKEEKFYRLTEIMVETNEKMNITAITDEDAVIALHFADSLLLLGENIEEGSKVCDIGCGGGFPCLPLAIVRPDLKITGVDSTAKKVNYVNMAAEELGLENLKAISGRAEEISAVGEKMRESYDVVCARAVAALPMLSELCLPFVKIGGRFIALKSKTGDDELSSSMKGIEILGGKLEGNKKTLLYTSKEDDTPERTIISIRKVRATPPKYPRAFGQIKKRPL